MKVILLVAGGRTGNEFFQSLLDSHSQILQFPGILKVDNNFINIINNKNANEIAKNFVKSFPQFFDSRFNKIERMHKLGKKKNNFFKVNSEKFSQNFLTIMKNSKVKDNLSVIKNLHLAYSKSNNKVMNKQKILLINTHLLEYTKKYINNFGCKDTEIICTIRHPLSALSSQIANNLNYKNGLGFFAKDLYKSFKIIFKDLYEYLNLCKVRVVRLEKLHQNHKRVLLNFCKVYNLNYERSLNHSTFLGLQWWGDALSKKWLSGINKNFKVKIKKDLFFTKDLYFFQTLSENFFRSYKYKYFFPKKDKFIDFFPLKSEIIVWKNSLKYFYKWSHLFSIPYFYILRILFINKLFIKKKKLPLSFGD